MLGRFSPASSPVQNPHPLRPLDTTSPTSSLWVGPHPLRPLDTTSPTSSLWVGPHPLRLPGHDLTSPTSSLSLQVNLTWMNEENDSGRTFGTHFYVEHQEWEVTPKLAKRDAIQHLTKVRAHRTHTQHTRTSVHAHTHSWNTKNGRNNTWSRYERTTHAPAHIHVPHAHTTHAHCTQPSLFQNYVFMSYPLEMKRKTTFYTHLFVAPSVLLMLAIPAMFIMPPDSGEKLTLGESHTRTLHAYLVFARIPDEHRHTHTLHQPCFSCSQTLEKDSRWVSHTHARCTHTWCLHAYLMNTDTHIRYTSHVSHAPRLRRKTHAG